MATIRLNGYESQGTQVRREFKETLAQNQASSEILIPYEALPTVRLFGFTDPGRAVEYTTSPEADIWAGTAIWTEWVAGTVTGLVEGRLKGAVTGIRLSGGSPGSWEIIA
jgi:hypothetical protein